ncbi:MAG: L,D-transpeptidase [Candidatus Nomurabacteria bacterium]|jgi:lipoprotein-anchoring transpeptidase ErfK/SrfK|nr:L,D-transpeptidase [Candidatus Nomurabacteria bacterium]
MEGGEKQNLQKKWLFNDVSKQHFIVKHGERLKRHLDTTIREMHPTHRGAMFWVLASLGAMAVLFVAFIGFQVVQYNDRVLPGVSFAGVELGGKNKIEARKIVASEIAKIEQGYFSVTKDGEEIVIEKNLGELGFVFDAEQSFDDLFDAKREDGFWSKYNGGKKVDVVANFETNREELMVYLYQNYAELVDQVREPLVIFDDENTQRFVVQKGVTGRVWPIEDDAKWGEILGLVGNGAELIDITPETVEPKLRDHDAEGVAMRANEIIDQKIALQYNGKLVYELDFADIVVWIKVAPKSELDLDLYKIVGEFGDFAVGYSDNLASAYLNEKIIPSMATAPVSERVLVDDDGNVIYTLQNGKNGLAPKSMPDLAKQIYAAIFQGGSKKITLNMTEKAFGREEIKVDGQKWIEVNLRTQRAMMWHGSELLNTFVISSGVSAFPTVTGEFRIQSKIATQLMTNVGRQNCPRNADGSWQYWTSGDKYCLPDVRWVMYFYGDYGFHTKYWNEVWGYPSSHGCVNMHEADAKTMFDWAEYGTRVVVHY